MGTQPVTAGRAPVKPMSTQRVVAKPAAPVRAVAKPAARPAAPVRAVAKPAVRAAQPVVRPFLSKPGPSVAAPRAAPRPVVRAAPRPVVRAAPRPVVRAAAKPVVRAVAKPAPKARAPAAPRGQYSDLNPAPPGTVVSAVGSVAGPSSNANGIDLLERVETLRLLTALYNAGALQKIERAGLLSSLEKAGALSSLEKLLPQLEALKPISLARNILSIPAKAFYGAAAVVAIGDLALLFEFPKVGVAATLAAIPVAIGLVIGGQVNGVVQGTTPVNLQSILGPRLRD